MTELRKEQINKECMCCSFCTNEKTGYDAVAFLALRKSRPSLMSQFKWLINSNQFEEDIINLLNAGVTTINADVATNNADVTTNKADVTTINADVMKAIINSFKSILLDFKKYRRTIWYSPITRHDILSLNDENPNLYEESLNTIHSQKMKGFLRELKTMDNIDSIQIQPFFSIAITHFIVPAYFIKKLNSGGTFKQKLSEAALDCLVKILGIQNDTTPSSSPSAEDKWTIPIISGLS